MANLSNLEMIHNIFLALKFISALYVISFAYIKLSEIDTDKYPQMESVHLIIYYKFSMRFILKTTNNDLALISTGEIIEIPSSKIGILTGFKQLALNVDEDFITEDYSIFSGLSSSHVDQIKMDLKNTSTLYLDREKGIICTNNNCSYIDSICPPYKLTIRVNGVPCKYFNRH